MKNNDELSDKFITDYLKKIDDDILLNLPKAIENKFSELVQKNGVVIHDWHTNYFDVFSGIRKIINERLYKRLEGGGWQPMVKFCNIHNLFCEKPSDIARHYINDEIIRRNTIKE